MHLLPADPASIIERGNASSHLLDAPIFTDAVNDLSNRHLSAIVASPPGPAGQAARDHHHLMHYALAEIVGELQGYVAAGDEMAQLVKLNEELAE